MREFAKAKVTGFYSGSLRYPDGDPFELAPGDECPAWATKTDSPLPAEQVGRKKAAKTESAPEK